MLIEIVEWSMAAAADSSGCTLENIFQVVIVVLIQATQLYRFLRALQLSFDHAVLCTVMCFSPQTTIGPQLSFGAEPVRGLDQRDQQGSPDRADPGNQAKQSPCLVLLAFQQQIPTYLLAQQT